jgi:stage II sporulation protein D
MKTIVYVVLFIFFITVVLPVFLTQGCDLFVKPEKGYIDEKPVEVLLYINDDKMIRTMDLEEYIKGVVAAEMPASFELEALKAQAVAARTYTVRRMKALGGSPNADHPDVDVCTDSAHCQAWIDQDRFKERLRKDFGLFGHRKYLDKISQAVDDTRGLILVYDDMPIDPLFHSTSGGFTENSEEVFASKVPYLRGVASPYEKHSPKYVSTMDMDADDFVRILNAKFDGLNISVRDIPDRIEITNVSQGGKIISLKIGGVELRGRDIRTALGLNSTNFKIDRQGDRVVITTIGYGHGVGMSQYGADGMARQGYGFRDILQHYYTGVQIKNMYYKNLLHN